MCDDFCLIDEVYDTLVSARHFTRAEQWWNAAQKIVGCRSIYNRAVYKKLLRAAYMYVEFR